MRPRFTAGTVLVLFALCGTAYASSLAELSATMGTSNALSAGAANGASTAHGAMNTVLRHLPTPGMPAEGAAPASSGSGSGWASPTSGHQTSTQSGWAKGGSSRQSQTGQSAWAKAGSGRQATTTSAWAKAGERSARR